MKKSVKIQTCFPENSDFNTQEGFLQALVDLSQEAPTADGQKRWGGFFGTEYLENALRQKFSKDNYKKYQVFTPGTKESIKQVIEKTVERCQDALPTPVPPLRIFVYPWFADDPALEGVNGTTFWQNTFHLYIDRKAYKEKSLQHTVAHEYNHAIYNNYDHRRTMLRPMVMEGLAEQFREDVLGGEMADWSQALSKKAAAQQLRRVKDNGHLDATPGNSTAEYEQYRALYREIFYGEGDRYEKWTGYAIGYWLVKLYRDKYPETSWAELMQTAPETYLSESGLLERESA